MTDPGSAPLPFAGCKRAWTGFADFRSSLDRIKTPTRFWAKESPMLPLRFFREKDFAGAVIVIGVVLFAILVSFFFLTQFFQIVPGRSAFQAGLLIVPTSLAMMFAAPLGETDVLDRSPIPRAGDDGGDGDRHRPADRSRGRP